FSVDLVAGRSTAAQVVVVHARQVVVHQAVRVQTLERGAGAQGIGRIASSSSTAQQRQQRPQPLAAREQRVVHRLVQAGRAGFGGGQQFAQGGFDARRPHTAELPKARGGGSVQRRTTM